MTNPTAAKLPLVTIFCDSGTKEFSSYPKLWGKNIARNKTITSNFDRETDFW